MSLHSLTSPHLIPARSRPFTPHNTLSTIELPICTAAEEVSPLPFSLPHSDRLSISQIDSLIRLAKSPRDILHCSRLAISSYPLHKLTPEILLSHFHAVLDTKPQPDPTALKQSLDLLQTANISLHPPDVARLLRAFLSLNNYRAFKETLVKYGSPSPSGGPESLYALAEIFTGLAQIGRGVGLMRRIMRVVHQLGYPPGADRLVEAYVGVLVRWGRLDRALAYLQMFDFGPSFTMLSVVPAPPSHFLLEKSIVKVLGRSNLPRNIFEPEQGAWAKLMSIYLLIGRPELVLEISESGRCLSHWDECAAHVIRAQWMASRPRDRGSSGEPRTRSPAFENSGMIGPATAEVLIKLNHDVDGPHLLLESLANHQLRQVCSGQTIVAAWLDTLLDRIPLSSTTPLHVGQCLVQLAELDAEPLVGEAELEKYLRYLRVWLETMIHRKIRDSFVAKDEVTALAARDLLTFDRDHHQLGYVHVEKLLQAVYRRFGNEDGYLKPSSALSAELSRIEALLGSPSSSIRGFIDESVMQPELGVKTSHMVGLAWSKLTEGDVVGLLRLLERELKFGYGLVLTGVLVSLVLGGLVAMRVPKVTLLQISHRLGEQQQQLPPSSSHSDEERSGPASYVRAARAAAAAGNFFLVRELHEEMINRFGHIGYIHAAGSQGGGMGDYLAMIVESLMRLNEPVQAHQEVLTVLSDADVLQAWLADDDPHAEGETEWARVRGRAEYYLGNEDMQRCLIDRQPSLLMRSTHVDPGSVPDDLPGSSVGRRLRGPGRLVSTLRESKRRLRTKMARLETLSATYTRAGEVERICRKKAVEVEARLKELRLAESLNDEAMRIWTESRGRKE